MSVDFAAQLPQVVVDNLPGHLVRQRWSGAASRAPVSVELVWSELLRDEWPLLLWTVARVGFFDDGQQDYQLFIGARPAASAPEFLHGKEREQLTLVPGSDGGVIVYDALVDPDLAIEVLHLAAPDLDVEVRRPIVLEHSNSSVVYDESSILKVFRKVEPGPNPDVEITRVLTAQGFPHVLAPLAELRREGTDLAVLRRFLVGAVDGWSLARASVRDVLAARTQPAAAGADFAPDSERLGTILGELHLAMADAWGPLRGDVAAWADEMEAHLRDIAAVDGFDVAAVGARYAELAAGDDPGSQIRIHGDLHLAQVVKGDEGWVVLDFEGEPARRRDERFTTSSPLRDVAGMLRSFHYAAAVGRAEWPEHDDELDVLVEAWEDRNRHAFLTAYLQVEGISRLLPTDPASTDLILSAFELDKAVYELGYEHDHRPDLVGIPLAGIERVIGTARRAGR